jgi:hypothetical protein
VNTVWFRTGLKSTHGLIRGAQQLGGAPHEIVEMEGPRSMPRAGAGEPTHAEHDLLHETMASVAAIRVIGQVASFWRWRAHRYLEAAQGRRNVEPTTSWRQASGISALRLRQ